VGTTETHTHKENSLHKIPIQTTAQATHLDNIGVPWDWIL